MLESAADAGAAMDDVVQETAAPYEQTWLQLTQREQRILRLLAIHPDTALTAEATRRAHALGAASSIGISIAGLRKKGVIVDERGQPRFDDPFFRRWVELSTREDLQPMVGGA